MKKLVVSLLAGLSLNAVWAADGYIGASLGSSHFNVDCAGTFQCSDSDVGLKLYGGLPINQNVAVEVGYTDFGQFEIDHGAVSVSALTLGVALRAPINHHINVVGRLGVAAMSTEGSGWMAHHSENHTQFLAGIGLESPLNKNWKVQGGLDLTNFEFLGDSGSLYMLHVGVQYGF